MKLGKYLFLGAILLLTLTGCSSKHQIVFNESYKPNADIKVEVGLIENKTNRTYDVDIQKMMKDSITRELGKRDLVYSEYNQKKIVFNIKILYYDKGNAFKRWIGMGDGSATLLEIEGDIKDDSKTVGQIQAHKIVDFGGLYTIGKWKSIYDDIAEDIVTDYIESIAKL